MKFLKCFLAPIIIVCLFALPFVAAFRNDRAHDRAVAYANKRFVELNCKRGHYVASRNDPIMIYNCDDGERTFDSLIQEGYGK